MQLHELAVAGILNLRAHMARTVLAMLGVIFGVAAIVAMLAISDGARMESLQSIESLGLRNIWVKSHASKKNPEAGYGLTMIDVRHCREHMPALTRIVAYKSSPTTLFAWNQDSIRSSAIGVSAGYMELYDIGMKRGRSLCAVDHAERLPVCVVGSAIADELFLLQDPIGQVLRIDGSAYRVVGIFHQANDLEDDAGMTINKAIILPLSTWQLQHMGRNESIRGSKNESAIDGLIVQAGSEHAVSPVAERLQQWLETSHSDKDYVVQIPLHLLRSRERTQAIFTIVMSSIAGIALLVGGIGIMNIMIANVAERRREIGVHRAIGATKSNIATLFLFEAIILTGTGGLFGIALGVSSAYSIANMVSWPVVISIPVVVLSLGTAVGTGVIFGLMPAYKAAAIPPIEALRAD